MMIVKLQVKFREVSFPALLSRDSKGGSGGTGICDKSLLHFRIEYKIYWFLLIFAVPCIVVQMSPQTPLSVHGGVTLRVTPLRDCVTAWLRGRGRWRTCKLPSSDSCYPEYLRRYTHGHVNHLSCRGPTIRIFIRTTKHQHNRSFSIVLLERLTT